MKALVGTFNQEKALVGAFSVIVQLHRLIVYSTIPEAPGGPALGQQRGAAGGGGGGSCSNSGPNHSFGGQQFLVSWRLGCVRIISTVIH